MILEKLQQKISKKSLGNRPVYVLCAIGAGILFTLDLNTPLGIAGGVTYFVIIFLTLLASNSRVIFVVATFCSLLAAAGYFFSPTIGTDNWIVLINRFLALLVIWSTALLLHYLKTEEGKLTDSESKYRTLVESTPICIHQIDSSGNFLSMNKAGLYMINETDEMEIIGTPYLSIIFDEDRERVSHLMNEAFEGQYSEFEFRGINGVEFSSNFVPIHTEVGQINRLMGMTQDISERNRAREKLSYQASHDSLTGLINRHEFECRVTRLLSMLPHDKSDHAICFLDLDQFKVINDTCGHTAGDELLRQLGKLLRETVRQRDTLARLGGDEFGLLLEHCQIEQAHRIAEAILDAIKGFQFFWEGQSFHIGISIGLVAITETTGNLTELFKQADAACYLAKDQGRNRIHAYHSEDADLATRHGEMQWVGRINKALDDNRFCLYAQPIVPLRDDAQKHYELLLRMRDEHGKIIPPGMFLPAAERYDLIQKLDTWVINHASAFMSENPDWVESINFVSINLSGPSMTNRDFLGTIMRNFREFGISPDKICFEITETVAISNLDAAASFVSILKQIGCRFALDDFGSGLSSFGYLKSLPVDYLKIDGMFVRDIEHDPIDRAMVKSINEIGQVMGKKTIAEFVENDEIKRMLKDIGVNYGQGYGLGKPEPLENLIRHSDNVRQFQLPVQGAVE